MSCSSVELDEVFNSSKGYSVFYTAEDPKGDIDIIFDKEITPVTWYSLNPLQFQCHPTVKKEECQFTTKGAYEYIMYSYLKTRTCALTIKNSYLETTRIGWTRNLLQRMVDHASIVIDDSITVQSYDHHWLVMEPEFFLEPGHEKRYDINVGNTSELTEMDTILPSLELSSNQPWFYCSKSSAAFPLFLINSQTRMKHVYKYELNISKLLRMKIQDEDGRWEDVSPDLERLEGLPDGKTLQVPILHGCFGKITQNQVIWKGEEMGQRSHRFIVNNIIEVDGDNKIECGNGDTVKLTSSGICRSMFWAAHNITREMVNDHCNYTISAEDPVDGNSPILTQSLKIGEHEKFPDSSPGDFAGPLVRHHFPRAPRVNGIYGFSFCYEPRYCGVESGVPLKDASFKIATADPDSYRWNNNNNDIRGRGAGEADKCRDKFRIIVRMMVSHMYSINSGGSIELLA